MSFIDPNAARAAIPVPCPTRESAVLEVLKDMRGWVQHWRKDVECGCQPFLDGFDRAETSLRDAIKMLEGTSNG